MDKLSIHGGATLDGEVRISGAKNAALPILTAALLSAEPLRLTNVPNLKDISTLLALLGHMGVRILRDPDGRVELNAGDLTVLEAPYDMVKTMRASILVLGPLLARRGAADVSLPDGCAIGARPVNLHVEGLKRLGAEIDIAGRHTRAGSGRPGAPASCSTR